MKTTPFINKGMVKDLSISKVSNEFAYENFNIRIETKGENSLMSCTNERGNEPVTLYKEVLLNGVTVDFVSGTIADVHIQLDSPSDVPLSFNFKGTILEMPAGESECVICGKLNERSSFTIIQPENSIYLFYDKALPKPSEESYAQIELEGEYLGHCALSPYLVLFTHEENTDRIYSRIDDHIIACRLRELIFRRI